MFNRLMQILAQRAMAGGGGMDKMGMLSKMRPNNMPHPSMMQGPVPDGMGRIAGGMAPGMSPGSPAMGMGSPMKPKMPMQKYSGGFGQMPQNQGPPDSDPQGY